MEKWRSGAKRGRKQVGKRKYEKERGKGWGENPTELNNISALPNAVLTH